MKINFVGNFATGHVGEIADETHLAFEIEHLGHEVRRIPRDEWREHIIDGKDYPNVPKDLKADLNIICKWHHFDDGSFIKKLRDSSRAPVFYWVWDYMWDGGLPPWHLEMVVACDLYLGNDVRSGYYQDFKHCYYFPFDVADIGFETYLNLEENYQWDVAFYGSLIGQGDRKEWLPIINKEVPVKIFSWNWEEWKKLGFDASPAVYGNDFNKAVAQTKINLGFSVHPSCWGYWSNRLGKTLLAGGFLLQQYAPGMELFFSNAIAYFSSPEEAIEKIKFYLTYSREREQVRGKGYALGVAKFSSRTRVKELMILAERYLKTKGKGWQL